METGAVFVEESEYRKGYVYIQNHFSGIIAEEKKETPVQAAPAPAVSAPQAAGTDDGELAAVIAAAIAASEGTSTDGFVVRSIKRRKSNKWN